jgi:hypothetical protein
MQTDQSQQRNNTARIEAGLQSGCANAPCSQISSPGSEGSHRNEDVVLVKIRLTIKSSPRPAPIPAGA